MAAELSYKHYFDSVGSQLMIEVTLLNEVAQVSDIIGRWPDTSMVGEVSGARG